MRRLAESTLSFAWVYNGFQRAVGAARSRRLYVSDYIQPFAGARILDIGCGPAGILDSLPDVHYVGVDLSAEYIREAQRRYGARGEFVCQPVENYATRHPGTFDIVMANGVLHHLDDAAATSLFAIARQALKPTGRLVTLDGCFVAGQSRIARWMLQNDRGRHVRPREEYVRLASAAFPSVATHLRHDLLRVPYTHLIMVCRSSDQNS